MDDPTYARQMRCLINISTDNAIAIDERDKSLTHLSELIRVNIRATDLASPFD